MLVNYGNDSYLKKKKKNELLFKRHMQNDPMRKILRNYLFHQLFGEIMHIPPKRQTKYVSI